MTEKNKNNVKNNKRTGPNPVGLYIAYAQGALGVSAFENFINTLDPTANKNINPEKATSEQGFDFTNVQKMFNNPDMSVFTKTYQDMMLNYANKDKKQTAGFDFSSVFKNLDKITNEEYLDFLEGLKVYREQTFSAKPLNWLEVTSFKTSTLYKCFEEDIKEAKNLIVLVPSPINGSDIFDLFEGSSLVDFLKESGYSPLVVDWGNKNYTADKDLNRFNSTPEVVEHLSKLIENLHNEVKTDINLLGYCLGGLYVSAVAQILANTENNYIKSVALAAMSFNFESTKMHKYVTEYESFYKEAISGAEKISVDFLQSQMFFIDPISAIKRIASFSKLKKQLDETNDEAIKKQLKRLTLIEDWLSRAAPLEANLAKEIIFDFHKNNKIYKGEFKINDCDVLDYKKIKAPIFIVIPNRDLLVPPVSAMSVLEKVSAQVCSVPSGHIGLMVGRSSEEYFYKPYVKWLNSI